MKNLTTVQKAMFLIVLPIVSILLIIASGIGAYSYSQSSKKAEIDSAVAKVEKEQNTAKEITLYSQGNYKIGEDINPGSYYIILEKGEEVWVDYPGDFDNLKTGGSIKLNLKDNNILTIENNNDDNISIKLVPADKYKPSDN